MESRDITRRFLLNEGDLVDMSIFARIQSIHDLLSNISPKSQADQRRIEMIFDNLKVLRRIARSLTPKETTETNIPDEG